MPLMAIIHEPSAISAAEGGLTRSASTTPSPPMAAFPPLGQGILSFSIQHSAFSIQY